MPPTPPKKTTGLAEKIEKYINPAGTLEFAKKPKKTKDSSKPSFTVSFGSPDNKTTWSFSSLPLIESQLGPGVKGANNPPGVKPGLQSTSAMAIKQHIVPGGSPITQSIGIRGTVHNFVGYIAGTEGVFTNGKTQNVNGTAYTAAAEFLKKIVHTAREVRIVAKTETGEMYIYTGIIVNFTTYLVREDKCYYMFDLQGTRY